MSETAAWKSGVTLGLIAAFCAALVAATWHLTKDRIAANEKAFLEASLRPALADKFFDGDVSESVVVLEPPHALPGRERALIYRVYADGEAVAALFVVTAMDGYAGPIRFVLGVDMDGNVSGVRILEHDETPGLGDEIEHRKSDWVEQFRGRSLGDPPVDEWRIRRDGGEFDALTGASVTPRAVIKAMRETLLYFRENKDLVFEMQESTIDDE